MAQTTLAKLTALLLMIALHLSGCISTGNNTSSGEITSTKAVHVQPENVTKEQSLFTPRLVDVEYDTVLNASVFVFNSFNGTELTNQFVAPKGWGGYYEMPAAEYLSVNLTFTWTAASPKMEKLGFFVGNFTVDDEGNKHNGIRICSREGVSPYVLNCKFWKLSLANFRISIFPSDMTPEQNVTNEPETYNWINTDQPINVRGTVTVAERFSQPRA